MKNLADWVEAHNKRNPSNLCPSDILFLSCSKELRNKWLCVYVSEMKNKFGNLYSPRSIHALLNDIFRKMRAQNPNYSNFLESSDPEFLSFTRTLDNLFKSLRSQGVGSTTSATENTSAEEEKLLWSSAVLNRLRWD